MASITLTAACLLAAFLLVEAGGHHQGGWQQEGEPQGRGMQRGGQQEDQGWQNQGPEGRNQGQDRGQGRSEGWQQGGRNGDNSKYRTNLHNDDDVYGYDATYPNGEVSFINYRNSDARSRRGPDFARSNSISSRRSGSHQSTQYGDDNQNQRSGGQHNDRNW